MPLPSLSISTQPDVIFGLPLDKSQAKCIIDLSTKVKGERAASVCGMWQLSPSQFAINNSQWTRQLQALMNKVKDELGCDPTMNITCEPHQLLLCETGGFYKVRAN